MKIASLFSGGKDSAFATWWAQMQGWDVTELVTVLPESSESWMFHYPGAEWTRLQADAMRIPLTVIRTKGVKENELDDLADGLRILIKKAGIEGIVSGAVASEYQRTRLDNLCEGLSLRSFAPLWHKNQQQLVREQIESGFEIIITACNALGITKEWLGRKLDTTRFAELVRLSEKYRFSIAFEGGEAETFVLNAPMFDGKIRVDQSIPHWKGDSGYLELGRLSLVHDSIMSSA